MEADAEGAVAETDRQYLPPNVLLQWHITNRCNLRCTYCMPAEGLAWLPKAEILTFEELTRVLRLFVRLGVRSVKVTGGEEEEIQVDVVDAQPRERRVDALAHVRRPAGRGPDHQTALASVAMAFAAFNAIPDLPTLGAAATKACKS